MVWGDLARELILYKDINEAPDKISEDSEGPFEIDFPYRIKSMHQCLLNLMVMNVIGPNLN